MRYLRPLCTNRYAKPACSWQLQKLYAVKLMCAKLLTPWRICTKVHYCCGHAILPKVGHWKPGSSQDFWKQNPATGNQGFGKQNAPAGNQEFGKQNPAPGNLAPMYTSTTTTPKPVFMCGSMEYDPDVYICCSARIYPCIVYMCCDGQVQGRPIEPACCNKFAYSRLSHKCVSGILLPHY